MEVEGGWVMVIHSLTRTTVIRVDRDSPWVQPGMRYVSCCQLRALLKWTRSVVPPAYGYTSEAF